MLLDLGPVVGSNVTFFGEQLGLPHSRRGRRVRHRGPHQEGHDRPAAGFFSKRFTQPAGSVDGILCWDTLDYLDRNAAQALATALTKLLRPDGALLGFFSTTESRQAVYTKYVVVDPQHLRYRTYPASRAAPARPADRRHHPHVQGPARLGLVPDEEQRAGDAVPEEPRLKTATHGSSRSSRS